MVTFMKNWPVHITTEILRTYMRHSIVNEKCFCIKKMCTGFKYKIKPQTKKCLYKLCMYLPFLPIPFPGSQPMPLSIAMP